MIEKEFEIVGVEQLQQVADWLLQNFPNGAVVLLKGDLGVGKTAFVKAFAKACGISEEPVSPSFGLMHEYEDGDVKIYHYDLYLDGMQKLMKLSLWERMLEEGFHLVEWGSDEIKTRLAPLGAVIVDIQIEQDGELRRIRIKDA